MGYRENKRNADGNNVLVIVISNSTIVPRAYKPCDISHYSVAANGSDSSYFNSNEVADLLIHCKLHDFICWKGFRGIVVDFQAICKFDIPDSLLTTNKLLE